eukprot:gene100-140_t
MATRNLTRNFLELRAANPSRKVSGHKKDDASESELLHGAGENSSHNWKASKESLPPVWIDTIDKIEQDIARIQSKMLELKGLHTKRLMVNFESDEVKQERDIDQKTQEITEIFRTVEGSLKSFSKHTEAMQEAERVVRNNIQRSMAKKLQGLSMSFRTSQKEYLSRLQAQKSGSGAQAFEFLGDKNKKINSNLDTGFTETQLQVVDDFEMLVNQKDEEITRIAKSIEELAQIFKELAVLVIDQGTILDRIDYNMEQAVENAKEGITQLEKAEEHQKNALSFRCICLLIVLIAVMLTILIVKHTSFQKS